MDELAARQPEVILGSDEKVSVGRCQVHGASFDALIIVGQLDCETRRAGEGLGKDRRVAPFEVLDNEYRHRKSGRARPGPC